MLEIEDESSPSETECLVEIGDEDITVEMLSKAINHSYVNLKRQNPLQVQISQESEPTTPLKN